MNITIYQRERRLKLREKGYSTFTCEIHDEDKEKVKNMVKEINKLRKIILNGKN
jgi:hypothetical protein